MDPETIKLLITTCGGPAVMTAIAGAIAAVWYYVTKVREPAREKERQVSSAYTREQARSLRAYYSMISVGIVKAAATPDHFTVPESVAWP